MEIPSGNETQNFGSSKTTAAIAAEVSFKILNVVIGVETILYRNQFFSITSENNLTA